MSFNIAAKFKLGSKPVPKMVLSVPRELYTKSNNHIVDFPKNGKLERQTSFECLHKNAALPRTTAFPKLKMHTILKSQSVPSQPSMQKVSKRIMKGRYGIPARTGKLH